MRYPRGTKTKSSNAKKPVDYANRGKGLENIVNVANEHYYRMGLGLVQFIETPMKQIVSGGQKVWVHAKRSTVDFFGTMKGGRSVAFDAKQTQSKTRFDLKNIGFHQVQFLEATKELGGAAFFIVEFTSYNKIFFVPLEKIAPLFHAAWDETGAKSVKYEWFLSECPQVRPGRGVVLDYLTHVDKL